MISFIEEEYDYQYSLIGTFFKKWWIVNDYENAIEDYYNNVYEDDCSLPCPRCYSGLLYEIQPSFTVCNKCGLDIPASLDVVQTQLSLVYQEHPCSKMLSCTFIPTCGLQFFCNECGFSKLMQYSCLFDTFFLWLPVLSLFWVISEEVHVCNTTAYRLPRKKLMYVFLTILSNRLMWLLMGERSVVKNWNQTKRSRNTWLVRIPFLNSLENFFYCMHPSKSSIK